MDNDTRVSKAAKTAATKWYRQMPIPLSPFLLSQKKLMLIHTTAAAISVVTPAISVVTPVSTEIAKDLTA